MINIPIILSVIYLFFHTGTKNKHLKVYLRISIITFLFVFSYMIGIRDASIGTDTERYVNYYIGISNLSFLESLEYGRFEPFFAMSVWFFSALGFSYQSYFTLVVIFMLYTFYKVTIFLTRSKFCAVLVLVLFISWPFFFSLSINVQRQAIAFSLMMLSFLAAGKNNNLLSIFLSLLSAQFHIIGVIALIFVVTNKSYMTISRAIAIWVFSVLICIFELSKNLILSFGFNRLEVYTSIDIIYKTGFRLDFFLLSILPFGLNLILSKKRFTLRESQRYSYLLKSYILLNATYFLFAFMPYSDRFAINSWMLIPFIIVFIVMKFKSLLLLLLPICCVSSFLLFNYLGL